MPFEYSRLTTYVSDIEVARRPQQRKTTVYHAQILSGRDGLGHFPRDIQATLSIGTPTISADPTLRVLVYANRACMRIKDASDPRITKLSTVKMCTHSACSRGTPAKRPSGRVSGVNSLLKSLLDYPTSQPEWWSILMGGFASRLTTVYPPQSQRDARVPAGVRLARRGFSHAPIECRKRKRIILPRREQASRVRKCRYTRPTTTQ